MCPGSIPTFELLVSNPNNRRKRIDRHFMLRGFAFALAVTTASLSLAAEESDPLRLVKRMVAATSALDYDGVFVYQRGQQIDSMRLVHRVNGETELERLVSFMMSMKFRT